MKFFTAAVPSSSTFFESRGLALMKWTALSLTSANPSRVTFDDGDSLIAFFSRSTMTWPRLIVWMFPARVFLQYFFFEGVPRFVCV